MNTNELKNLLKAAGMASLLLLGFAGLVVGVFGLMGIFLALWGVLGYTMGWGIEAVHGSEITILGMNIKLWLSLSVMLLAILGGLIKGSSRE